MPKRVTRLYHQFQPTHYDVHISPHRSSKRFSGTVTITGKKVGRPSQRISLHQKELKIGETRLERQDKSGNWEDVPLDRTNTHNSYDELRLHAPQVLYPGTYRITVAFSGKITDSMQGMYPCYFEHDGQKKFLVATQFESHHAREALPCIDEPEAKAIFQLTITTDGADTVLSNTPVQTINKTDDKQTVTFEPTPVMSPYLLAFVTGEMHCQTGKSKDGVVVSSWATVAQPKKLLTYANKAAIETLEFFSEYFDVPFPLPKCDHVALPDFEAGAMENWGLITYREITLLTDLDDPSLSSQQYISMVIAHELSHQWFGNLVTMKWWDDLWLNESFAGIMEHIALAKLHPDWYQWEQYMIMDVLLTSARDVYKEVQPVRVEVTNPDMISTLFDPAIVYTKGGRLIRMLLTYLGEDNFRKGLKTYFEKFAYQNTTRDDLWAELQKASHVDVAQFMNPWLHQSGMPLVRVTMVDKTHVSLSQRRLLFDGDDDHSLWPVPLLANQKTSVDVLHSKEEVIEVEVEDAETLVINSSGTGHYVVHYEDKAKQTFLAKQIASQSLITEDRINVLNDLLLLAKGGQASITEALEIVAQCKNEPRDAVWGMLARVIAVAGGLGEYNQNIEQPLKAMRRMLAGDWYQQLGWDDRPGDDPNTQLLRQSILGILVAGEHPDVIAQSLERYSKAKSLEDINAEQRALILITAVRHGDSEVIDRLIDAFPKTHSAEMQLAISNGLAECRDSNLIEKIIHKALGKNGFVRDQDIFRWFALMMRNRYTREQIWQWLEKDWQMVTERVGTKMFDDIPVYAAGPLNTPEWEKKYKAFFEPKLTDKALERNIRVGMADIRTKVEWRKREEPLIEAWLKNYFSD